MSEVVSMLKDMLKKSEDDWKADNEAYMEYKKYCEENTNQKTEDIAEGKKSIALLENRIEELQGSTGKLSLQVAKLKAEMDENKQAREEADALRKKQKEAYEAEKKDLEGAIAQLKEAIEILGEVGADQTKAESAAHKQFMADYKEKSGALLTIRTSVKEALDAASSLASPAQRQKIAAFLQAPFTGTYMPQSGAIVGILKDMEMTFQTNLDEATAREEKEIEAHEKFIENKKKEYDDLEKSYNDKQGPGPDSLSGNDEDLSTKKTELSELKKTLTDNEAFLETLTESCANAGKGYEEHKKWAENEQISLNKAIQILTNDVAQEKFSGQDATKFLQLSSRRHATNTRSAAAALLQQAAKQQRSRRLNQVLLLLQAGNPFTVVLEQIDEMIKLAEKEQKVDDAEKKWCEKTNKKNEESLDEKKEQLSTLEDEIKQLNDDISAELEEGLKFRIKDTEEQLKTNLENQGEQTKTRREDNLEYQKDMHNMEDSINIIHEAEEVLREYYDKLDNEQLGDFIQISKDKEEPKTFDKFDGSYKGGNEKGKEIFTLLENLVKATEEEANGKHGDEAKAQADYEDAMKELTDTEEELRESIVKFHKELTEKEKELQAKYEEQTDVEKEKIAVERYIEKINGKGSGCEFILGKYEERKTARGKEKDALEGAKEKLKGTPAFAAATQKDKEEKMGKCKELCLEDEEGAKCKACMAGISVPGYCAGHPGASGC
jgi:hypothetical protein